MYDIEITQNGCPVLEHNDVVPVSYEHFIGQKIYNALMTMDLNHISGIHYTKTKEIEAHIKDYLYAFFIGDLDIDPAHITIVTAQFPGSDKIGLSIAYKGTSPSGEEITYQSSLSYAVKAGAVHHADFEPDWLSTAKTYNEKDIVYPIRVREITDTIEIPLEPFPVDNDLESSFKNFGSPIYLVFEDQIENISTVTEDTFEIPIQSGRTKYPLSSYIPGYIRRETIIDDYTCIQSADMPEYYTIIEHGEPVIVVDKHAYGSISGTVRLRHAVQVTNIYTIKHTMVASPLFPLRRQRGKYFALFPKTIQIGDYYIMYKGLVEV